MTERDDTFSPNLGDFLVPIAGTAGVTGPSMRYDPVWAQIQLARERDDPDLPMGDWSRPLKQSDWVLVEKLCSEVTQKRSKDLQVAFWLCEAWIHRHGIPGLQAGVDLVMALVRQFWDGVHPVIDDGDTDARVSPFVWANAVLPGVLRLEVPLVHMPDHRPEFGTLDLWERMLVAKQPAKQAGKQAGAVLEDGAKIGGRAEMMAHASGAALFALAEMGDDLHDVLTSWKLLSALLDEKLVHDAPSLGKVTDVLEQMERAVSSLLDGRDPRAVRPEPDSLAVINEPEPLLASEPTMTAPFSPEPVAPAPQALTSGQIANRDDAYRLLEIAAAYLERNEPHSPTPYLVKRAVTWGRMSLSDLMQEILREEGDLNRYFSLLGINNDRG